MGEVSTFSSANFSLCSSSDCSDDEMEYHVENVMMNDVSKPANISIKRYIAVGINGYSFLYFCRYYYRIQTDNETIGAIVSINLTFKCNMLIIILIDKGITRRTSLWWNIYLDNCWRFRKCSENNYCFQLIAFIIGCKPPIWSG